MMDSARVLFQASVARRSSTIWISARYLLLLDILKERERLNIQVDRCLLLAVKYHIDRLESTVCILILSFTWNPW